jgi:hypothetical protein
MTKIVTSSPSGQFVLAEPLKKDFSVVTQVSARMKKVGFTSFYIKLARELLASAGKNADLLARAMISSIDSGTFEPGSPVAREFVRRMKS